MEESWKSTVILWVWWGLIVVWVVAGLNCLRGNNSFWEMIQQWAGVEWKQGRVCLTCRRGWPERYRKIVCPRCGAPTKNNVASASVRFGGRQVRTWTEEEEEVNT